MSYTNRTSRDSRVFAKSGHYSYNASPTTESTLRNYDVTRSGSKVEDYKQKIRQGVQAGSAFTLDGTYLVTKKSGSIRAGLQETVYPWRSPFQVSSGFAFVPEGTPTHLGSSFAKADAQALTKIYNKIRQEQEQMNSLAFLGEFKETMHMLKRPFATFRDELLKYYDRLKKAKVPTFERTRIGHGDRLAKVMASSYLEFVFGVRPVLSDTAKIAETIARWELEKDLSSLHRSRVSARARETLTATPIVSTDSFSPTWISGDTLTVKSTDLDVQYIVGLSQSRMAAFGSAQRLRELSGFTLENFVPAAYEVLPYSWLLDYFTNIGDIINAGFTNTSSIAWIIKTTVQRTHVTKRWQFVPKRLYDNAASSKYRVASLEVNGYDSTDGYYPGGLQVVRRVTLTRTLPSSLNIPSLVFETPFENVGKMLNVLALGVQRDPGFFRQLTALARRF